MPTPIITLPIHTIEQARALAGLLRAFIDGQSPDTNDGQDWKPDPDLAGIAALYAHLDAGIDEALGASKSHGFRVGDTVRFNDKAALRDIGKTGFVLKPTEDESVRVRSGFFIYACKPETLDLVAPATP